MRMKQMMLLAAVALSVVASQAQTVDICDRTAQVRDAILAALDADDCAAVNSESLAGVEDLESDWRLTALQAGDFDGLASLLHLDLRYNQLRTLPAGVFDGLTGLVRLHLDDNQLTTLPAGVFDRLTSLQELDLRDNQLVGLTRNDDLFAELSSV